ncbi:MAG: phage head spike fiber domain-containing protein, partial [Desulfobulbia bacterium]
MAVVKDAVSNVVRDAVRSSLQSKVGTGDGSYYGKTFGGVGDFQYLRASGLLQVGEAGILRYHPNDQIAPDFPGGIRVEPASTNLLPRSGDMTNAAWTLHGSATRTGGQDDIAGGTTAILLDCIAGGTSYIKDRATVTANEPIT